MFSYEFSEISKNTLFTEDLLATASVFNLSFHSISQNEFAKLRVFRAYVPYVTMCLTCLLAFVPQINTCLRALNCYVPTWLRAYGSTCLRALNYYVVTCLRAYVPLFFTCLRAFIFHVLTCLQPLTKYIEAHFYTLHCYFSLDYLQKQPPEVFFKKRCS